MKILFVLLTLLMVSSAGTAQAYTSNDYYQAGRKLYGAQDYAHAIQYFSAAIKLDPNNIGALQGRANCYYTQGQYQNALSDYQQVLALNPSPQLSAFVEKVKEKAGMSTAAAPAVAPTGDATAALSQGSALFQQKQYAAAIPYFQQATQQDPSNYKPYYYLGFAQLMTGDKRSAALSLSIVNQLHPNASIAAYVQRLEAGLSMEDQLWVSANLNRTARGGSSNNLDDSKMIGIRFEPGIAMVSLSDFNADAQYQVAAGSVSQSNGDTSYQVTAAVPAGYADITVEPTLKVLPFLELGLPISVMPVGSYTVSSSDSSGYSDSTTYSISAFGVGVNARFFYGDGPIKLFGSLGPMVVPVSLNYTDVNSGYGTVTGSTSSLAIGGQIEAGADLHLGGGLLLSAFLGYRSASASGFTGTFTGSGVSENAEFYVSKSTLGSSIFAADSATLSSYSASSYRPLVVDLSSVLAGVQFSMYF